MYKRVVKYINTMINNLILILNSFKKRLIK